MRRPLSLLIFTLGVCLAVTMACRPKPVLPAWVQTAPGDSLVAFSGEAGWVLSHPEVRALLTRDPLVERALDLFLQKARINPRTETGRVTFHVLGLPARGPLNPQESLGQVLVQLHQFKDPSALVAALAEAFPQEGALRVGDRDWPLHVILDVEVQGIRMRLRAASDERGQVWIGTQEALGHLAQHGSLTENPDVLLAGAWISRSAPFQGFLQPEALMTRLKPGIETSALKDLPRGVKALFWSITPPLEANQPLRFELALAGSPEGIQQVAPWLQRLVAATQATQGSQSGSPAELLQEKRRVSLRCTLTLAQLKLVLEKLGQPGLHLPIHRSLPNA